MKPRLITSIPPRMSRVDSDGVEIGESYLRKCAASWFESGFDIYSINSLKERGRVPLIDGVRYVFLDRDASAEAGKPLVYLEDLLNTAVMGYQGPVAITNADILFSSGHSAAELVSGITEGTAALHQRLDFHRLSSIDQGQVYVQGLDLFLAHSDDLKKVSLNPFVFGMPWWDHYLPIALMINGVSIQCATPGTINHLIHQDRWDFDSWYKFGCKFAQSVERVKLEKGNSLHINWYFNEYRDIQRSLRLKLKSALRFRGEGKTFSRSLEERRFHEVSKLNLRLLTHVIKKPNSKV